MNSFFFVVKVLMLTVLVVMSLQIEVRGKKLEEYSYSYITEASQKMRLNQVAAGLVQALNEGRKMIDTQISKLTGGDHQPRGSDDSAR